MRYLITFLALFLCLTGFSQTDYLLVNKTRCDLIYNLRVVSSNNCANIISTTNVTVPVHSSSVYTVPPGTELMHVAVFFVVNNCVGINMSSPANAGCPNCPNWYGTQGSWVSTCLNNCIGMTFNWKWFQSCTNVDQIVVYN